MTEKGPIAAESMGGGAAPEMTAGSMATVGRQSAALAMQEFEHRTSQQRSVYMSALGFILLLYVVAIVFASIGLFHMTGREAADWHAAILGSTYVIPPTLLLIALIRAIYPRQDNGGANDMPSVDLIKESIAAGKELLRR